LRRADEPGSVTQFTGAPGMYGPTLGVESNVNETLQREHHVSTSSFHRTHPRHSRSSSSDTTVTRVRHRVVAHRNNVRARRDLQLTLSGYYGWAAQAELTAIQSRR